MVYLEVGDIISVLWAKRVVEVRRDGKSGGATVFLSGISGLLSDACAPTLLAK